MFPVLFSNYAKPLDGVIGRFELCYQYARGTQFYDALQLDLKGTTEILNLCLEELWSDEG